MVPPVQFFLYCTAGTKLYLPCNLFRIARQVRNCTCCAIFSVLRGSYEMVPPMQFLCFFADFSVLHGRYMGFCIQGGTPENKVPKRSPTPSRNFYFGGSFLDHFPPKCTCYAILWGRLFSATLQGHQRCSNESPTGPPEAKKEAHGIQNGSPGPPQNEENDGSGAKE